MSLQDLLAVVPSGSEEMSLLRAIDFGRLPRHVAIIMDGNGRWAKLRHKRRVEGHRAGIASVRDELRRGMERTRSAGGLLFNIALNYGGRAEIVDGVRRLVQDVLANGRDPGRIDEALVSSYLYTAGQPDPDLLIRTSGELRISNFLLWQIAYAE